MKAPTRRRGLRSCLAMFVVSLRWTAAVLNCVECGPGTYGPGGRLGSTRNCTSCPAGTFSAAIGAQDESTCLPCRAGTYSDASGQGFCLACGEGSSSESGASECHECSPGTYSGVDDFGICKRCPVGTWSNKSGLASAGDCTPCAAGSFGSSTGENSSDACEPCRAGTYSAAGSGQCDTCPPGESSPVGASRCTKCDPGTYSGANDFGLCRRCPVGTWSNKSGLASAEACDDCPAGTFGAATGSNSSDVCKPCTLATYSSQGGVGQCELCPAGYSTNGTSGATECVKCRPGFYSTSESSCRLCKHPLSSTDGSASCPFCVEGYYPVDTNDNGEPQCRRCPDHTKCIANTSVETMELLDGFWRASRSTDSIVQCRRYSGWSRCMGGISAGEEGDGYCQAGFAGPECELCADVDGKLMHRVGTSRCEPCFSESSTPTARTAAAIGKLIGACLAVALLVGALVLVHRQQAWRDRRVVGPCLKFSDRCIARSHAIGLAAKASPRLSPELGRANPQPPPPFFRRRSSLASSKSYSRYRPTTASAGRPHTKLLAIRSPDSISIQSSSSCRRTASLTASVSYSTSGDRSHSSRASLPSVSSSASKSGAPRRRRAAPSPKLSRMGSSTGPRPH